MFEEDIMDDNDSFVRVTIFGQDYTVKAPADSTYIQSIATFVDEKMREVQSGFSTTQSSTRIAILAGMNITDELFNARQSGDSKNNDAEQKISSLIDLIDDTL